MSNYDYSSTAIIRGEQIKKLVRKAYFHFDGYEIEYDLDEDTDREIVHEEHVVGDYLDIAVLFGIRETHSQQSGDEPLNDYEINLLLERIQNPETGFKKTINEKLKEQAGDIVTMPFSEYFDRKHEVELKERDDGDIELYFETWTDPEIWIALTNYYKDEIVIFEEEEYDEESLTTKVNRYVIQNGKTKLENK